MSENVYEKFENWVAEIFKEAGYSIEQNPLCKFKSETKPEMYKSCVDMIADKDDLKYCVEIKSSNITELTIIKICMVAEKLIFNCLIGK